MLNASLQQLVLQLHLFTTLFMTGIIWFVQVVHYPSFNFFSTGDDGKFARFHQQRTGWVVMPVMIVELGTAILLLGSSWVMQYGNYLWINLALLLTIWVVTFFKIAPLHGRLRVQHDATIVGTLVGLNWIRTLLWTLRSLLLLSFLG